MNEPGGALQQLYSNPDHILRQLYTMKKAAKWAQFAKCTLGGRAFEVFRPHGIFGRWRIKRSIDGVYVSKADQVAAAKAAVPLERWSQIRRWLWL